MKVLILTKQNISADLTDIAGKEPDSRAGDEYEQDFLC